MKLGAVIVAAGMSSRMGEFKALKKVRGQTVIEEMVDKLTAAGATHIVIVTGHCADSLEKVLQGSSQLSFVFNPDYEHSDMFTSAKLGLAALSDRCDKFFFTPADCPAFAVSTLRKLIAAKAPIAKPVCHGRGGHPILLEKETIPFILNYKGGQGMKGAIRAYSKQMIAVQVTDEGILFNTNTPEDFEEMRRYYRENQTYIMA